MNSVAKYFRFDELGTNFRTEIIAGLTTFVSMAYILFVNPTVLGAAGMDKGAVFTATGVATAIATIFMGLPLSSCCSRSLKSVKLSLT